VRDREGRVLSAVLRVRIVGFYTKEYAAQAADCQTSALKFGWKADFSLVVSTGSWVRNCGMKADFLRYELKQSDERILYVDADARFRADPIELADLDASFDIGVHFMKNPRQRGRGELLSGTILLDPTPKAKALLDAWVELVAKEPTQWDQRLLQRCIEASGARVLELAPEWCLITDLGRRRYPGVNPKIEHFQASRRLRHKVERR
jgi:hypothetical protein